MTKHEYKSASNRSHLRMLTTSLKVAFPVEDSGSFASLLAAFDRFEREPSRTR